MNYHDHRGLAKMQACTMIMPQLWYLLLGLGKELAQLLQQEPACNNDLSVGLHMIQEKCCWFDTCSFHPSIGLKEVSQANASLERLKLCITSFVADLCNKPIIQTSVHIFFI